MSRKYQKDDAKSDVIERGGVKHIVFNNIDKKTVVWTRENLECSISLVCHEDIHKEIVKSIYVTGGN